MSTVVAPAALITPTDGMVLRSDARLKPGVYLLPNGLTIDADNVTLDGNGAMVIGRDRGGAGITIRGRRGVTIRNVRLREYHHGIVARECGELLIEQVHATSTAETPANTIFLDIWKTAAEAYGGAILLDRVDGAEIRDNDVQHQFCGLYAYGCRALRVLRNNASYSSGFGFHLFETSDSHYEGNYADYCCRYEPRDKDPARATPWDALGHMGADATGFLIVQSSCRNVFRGNYARMGGDGFFLAGRGPGNREVPCNDNLFEFNDGSLSPNIAFEATFSERCTFRHNRADRCNYGFWCGFSSDFVIEANRMVHNRQAGIAVENGRGFEVRDNHFHSNQVAGVLLWSKYLKEWHDALPQNRTVHHWTIEGNRFTRNGAGIAILADKDHGIRPMPAEACGRADIRPHDHAIVRNDIQDNRVGIDLYRTDRVRIEQNTISRNVECDVRQDDAVDTLLRGNLGLVGGYL